MDIKKFFSDLVSLVHSAEKELVPDPGGAKFTEADVQAAEKRGMDARSAETEKERKDKEEAQRKLKEIETKARKDEIHAFCESMAKEGKLIPAWQKMGIEEFIFNLDADQSIKFAEGHEKSRSQWFKDFLTELPKVVTFREVTPSGGPDGGGSAADKLNALTKKKMEEKKDLSFSLAFTEVQKENPELAKEYELEIHPSSK